MTPVVSPRKRVDPVHRRGVAGGEVIVDGDDVDALSCQRVEVDRQRRHQGLAFTGLHFSNRFFVQDHAADQLDIERPQPKRTPRGFAGNGEGRNQEVVQRLAVCQLLAEFHGLCSQRFVGKRFGFCFKGIDGSHLGLVATHTAVIR